MDVTALVRSFLKVADPEVVRLQDGVLQGRAVGATTVQVSLRVCVCECVCVCDVTVVMRCRWCPR